MSAAPSTRVTIRNLPGAPQPIQECCDRAFLEIDLSDDRFSNLLRVCIYVIIDDNRYDNRYRQLQFNWQSSECLQKSTQKYRNSSGCYPDDRRLRFMCYTSMTSQGHCLTSLILAMDSKQKTIQIWRRAKITCLSQAGENWRVLQEPVS